jgi:hypothetical protein
MARTHDTLDENLREWIAAQHVFFVASAPTATDGHVNLSPKGYDSFRVLDDQTVAYLDLTGSGVETIAHVNENSRLTLMSAGSRDRRILRLFGRARSCCRATTTSMHWWGFPPLPAVRSVIRCHLDRIQSSCGYSVPFMDYGPSETLTDWAARKGPGGHRGVPRREEPDQHRRLTGLPPRGRRGAP